MVLEDGDVGLPGGGLQQRPLNLASGDVFRMQDAALGMPAFLAQVELPPAVFARGFPFGKARAQFDQLGNARRPFLDDLPDDSFLA